MLAPMKIAAQCSAAESAIYSAGRLSAPLALLGCRYSCFRNWRRNLVGMLAVWEGVGEREEDGGGAGCEGNVGRGLVVG